MGYKYYKFKIMRNDGTSKFKLFYAKSELDAYMQADKWAYENQYDDYRLVK